ncbi:MAG TPA: DUF4815 domain-containing protein, partial [Candidatus Thioglobus sp.]|nr:DUF4815 domain-containing protein [Candidatus Thioglobus sp.]
MQTADGAGDVTVGNIMSTRVVAVSRIANNTRLWLEWQPSIIDRLGVTKSIRNFDGSVFANIQVVEPSKQATSKSLVFGLEFPEIKSIDADSALYDDIELYKGVVRAGTAYTITAPDNDTDFYGSGGIIQLVATASGKEYTDATVTATIGAPSTIVVEQSSTMAADGVSSIDVVLKRRRGISEERRKTLTSVTLETQSTGAGTSITLDQCDTWKISYMEVSVAGANAFVALPINPGIKLNTNTSDVLYDYGTITGLSSNKDYRVTYTYWDHSDGDYFTVNSYMIGTNVTQEPDLYNEIPNFISDDRKVSVNLRNAFDFRRKVTDLTTSGVPLPEAFLAVDYQHYLSRIDSISIGTDGKFRVSTGIPAVNPDKPLTTANTMRMWNILVRPYTLSISQDVVVTILAQQRFTMSDIGSLAKRISNLEYYSSTSQLSQSAQALTVTDSQGNSKFKNGIFVDNFTTMLNGNTYDSDYLCSIIPIQGTLRSSFEMGSVDVISTLSTAELATAGIARNNATYTLAYTTTPFIEVGAASGALNVNPYAIFTWTGDIFLTPASDNWVDTTFLPDIHVDGTGAAQAKLNVLNAGAEPIWGSWNDTIIGVELGHKNEVAVGKEEARLRPNGDLVPLDHGSRDWTFTKTTTQSDRTGVLPTYELASVDVVDERLVSSATIYFQRANTITYSAEGLYPNINLSATYNGQDESANCTVLVSDDAGRCEGSFSIPAGTYRTGSTIFALSDADVPLEPRTEADAVFESAGTLNTRQNTITSVGSITTTMTTVNETKTSNEVTAEVTNWHDPLAQSFLVQEDGGCYISSVEIFFNSKDDVIPVDLRIVENTNGYPTQKELPFSKKFMYPEDINVSSDGSVGTVFTFDDPVYVNENTEYSFVVISNSNNYRVFVGEIGTVDLATGEVIDKQPYAGVLFKSQNASTWTADQTRDMKFNMNKCVFETDTLRSMTYTPDTSTMVDGDQDLTLMNPNFEILALPDTIINLKYQFTDVETPLYVVNKSDNDLQTQQTILADGTSQFEIVAEFTSANANLTPIISSERTSIIAVNNLTFDIGNAELDAGRYVSANVKLTTLSDDIRVIFDAFLPGGSSVRPYYRTTKYTPKYVTIEDS